MNTARRHSRIIEHANGAQALTAVPTVLELHARGLARLNLATHKGGSISYTLTDEGQAEIYAAMKVNSQICKQTGIERASTRRAHQRAEYTAQQWAQNAFTE